VLAALASLVGMASCCSGLAGPDYAAGYLILPVAGGVDRAYGDGFSLYVPAWPLLERYPGHEFQTGLPGTWMFAQVSGEPLKDAYSDVEGGLGWWRDTRFPTETPKFIMGGVGLNFSAIANGPAHGAGTWEEPRGLYGVAQLSNRLVFPIDGLNVAQGACGQLFGYGYLNLPLADPQPRGRKGVPTGGNCWTLFLNTANFKGPVAFFLPGFWSESAASDARLTGRMLDAQPSDPNRAVQMETQYVPCKVAADSKGGLFAKLAPVRFPLNHAGDTVLLHRDTVYREDALRKSVEAWFRGGPAASGRVDPRGAFVRQIGQGGYATWEIRWRPGGGEERKAPLHWDSFAEPLRIDAETYGYRWRGPYATRTRTRQVELVTLPQYYRLERTERGSERWVPVAEREVPAETGLRDVRFGRPEEPPQEPYTTPESTDSPWKKPGPVAGPFRIRLGDGSVVVYSWYRFADQPSLVASGLSKQERERMQAKVERIHRALGIDRDYLIPPAFGTLARLDPAQIVRPPKGLEVGYVPIATHQGLPGR